MLSDRDLEGALDRGDMSVHPLRLPIQPSSVDLRLGNQLRVGSGSGRIVDPTQANDNAWINFDLHTYFVGHAWVDRPLERGEFVMPAGAFVLGHTLEVVKLGPSLAAYVDGRSTLARNGLSVHVTAGFIDPGFEGQITLELSNVAPWPLLLKFGMPIAQLVVHRMSSPVRRPYGSPELGSKYQRQVGATLARSNPDLT